MFPRPSSPDWSAAPQATIERISAPFQTMPSARGKKTERTYVEPCASTLSRNPDMPIRDVPSSVHVVNRGLMDDQRALTIGDALRNVSGVQGSRGRR